MNRDNVDWQAEQDGELQHKMEQEYEMKTELNDLSFDDLVPSNSKYLSKNDVGEDGVDLTIRGFKNEIIDSDDGKESKIVMYFVEQDYKPMILNRTNSQLIGICTGAPNAGAARGKKVNVYNDPSIGFAGKITGGLRIRKPIKRAGTVSIEEMENDVPF
jgi:hypothetical protein